MNTDILLQQKSQKGFPHPTPEQLVKINRYTPAQTTPLESHEVVVVTYTVADNLVNRSSGKWDISTLETLATLLPGLPFTLDHDWNQTRKEQGRVFDARLIDWPENTSSTLPLNKAGNFNKNSVIVCEEGLFSVETDVYISSDSEILTRLRKGMHAHVSLGGFRVTDYICPICRISFLDDRCPHEMPYPGEIESETSPPYYIRTGLFDACELSAVLIPNLPNARIKLND